MARAKKKVGTALTNLKEQIAQQAAQISNTVGSSGGNRIRITQGKKFVSPDGEESSGPIYVVILDHNSQNHYFPNPFDRDNPEPPTCFALSEPASVGGRIDNLVPSPNSPEVQSSDCNSCPMNQFGTDARGRGKACKNTYVLAVMASDEEDPAEADINLLTISPSGLKRYGSYVKTLASKGAIPMTVITELSFDPDEDYPTLYFKATEPNPNLETHWTRLAEAQTMLREEPDLTTRTEESSSRTKKKASKKTRRRVA